MQGRSKNAVLIGLAFATVVWVALAVVLGWQVWPSLVLGGFAAAGVSVGLWWARRRREDVPVWSDQERIALFCEKAQELFDHRFVKALSTRGIGFEMQVGERD